MAKSRLPSTNMLEESLGLDPSPMLCKAEEKKVGQEERMTGVQLLYKRVPFAYANE